MIPHSTPLNPALVGQLHVLQLLSKQPVGIQFTVLAAVLPAWLADVAIASGDSASMLTAETGARKAVTLPTLGASHV